MAEYELLIYNPMILHPLATNNSTAIYNAKRQRGYSLIELLVSGVIFALVVLAVTSMYRSQAILDDDSNLRRQALDALTRATQNESFYPDIPNYWSTFVVSQPKIIDTLTSPSGQILCEITATVSATRQANIRGSSISFREAIFRAKWGTEELVDTAYFVPNVFNYGKSDGS